MIEYLRGVLLERQDDHLVIEVDGVGYGVSVPTPTANQAGEPGAETALWVRTYVREDALRLYGFATRHERDVFDIFLGLSGVGPGLGLAILSDLSISEIVQATLADDSERFREVKGIGPKMAQKLIIELRGRVKRLAASLPEPVRPTDPLDTSLRNEAARDAVAALEALDVRPAQARRAIALALHTLGNGADAEALVREGLKHRHASS